MHLKKFKCREAYKRKIEERGRVTVTIHRPVHPATVRPVPVA